MWISGFLVGCGGATQHNTTPSEPTTTAAPTLPVEPTATEPNTSDATGSDAAATAPTTTKVQPTADGSYNVAPPALEKHRIAGNRYIAPSNDMMTRLHAAGLQKAVGAYKVCVDETGHITSVKQLKSIADAEYDTLILHTIETTWKYAPFMVNGEAAKVCSAVTYILTL
jgi:hypothetical protein